MAIHQMLMKIAKFIVMNYKKKRKQIFEIYCNSFEIVIKYTRWEFVSKLIEEEIKL